MKYWLKNSFVFNVINKFKYLFLYLDSRKYLKYFSIVIQIWLKIPHGNHLDPSFHIKNLLIYVLSKLITNFQM
jgi:hypothetical protein